MKNISYMIKDALSTIDTLHLIPLSVWLTINNGVGRVSMSSRGDRGKFIHGVK